MDNSNKVTPSRDLLALSVSDRWNRGLKEPSFVRGECLQQIFESSADLHPDNIAIDFADENVTYAELEARANSMARYLGSLGVEKGSCVGLCLPKSVELYVSMLAILKAGAAYIPIDPSYPADRISYILKNSGIKVFITNSQSSESGMHGGVVINIDKDGPKIAKFSSVRLSVQEVGITTDDLAYIIYTSGSTGNPKGVMIEHKGVCHLVRASQSIYGITSKDRVYQGISVAFDFSIEEIWMAFANGATLIPATPEMTSAGGRLSQLLTEKAVTAMSCVPTLLTMLDDDVPTLRFINVGGEDCPQALINQWSKPGRVIFNTYGPTETSVNATYAECAAGKRVTIGRPLPNFIAYVLDEEMRQVASGHEGELHIGGIGLARGYANRADLTAEKFVANPFEFDAVDFPRLYKTGDLVKFDENGEIIFLGRIDTQVKIRGFRIELSEIETVVSDVPDVKTAIATVYEEAADLKSIVVYIVLENEKNKFDFTELRSVLRKRLPAYMIPRYIEIIREVPLTPNGKIWRKGLPTPQTNRHLNGKDNALKPRTKVEEIIAKSWEKVFASNSISITDHFFYDLGGHSLFAAKVISDLRTNKDFHNPSVSDIYANPTVEALAMAMEERKKKALIRNNKSFHNRFVNRFSKLNHTLCAIAQGLGIYFLYFIVAIPFMVFYLFSRPDQALGFTMGPSQIVIYLILTMLAYFPAIVIFSIVAKWLIVGKFKQGEYPLWGSFYFRFWLVRRVQALVPLNYFVGTPLMSLYLRLMGAKIGSNCFIGSPTFQIFDMLNVGNNVSIGAGSHLLGYEIEDGFLKIAPIVIGDNCFIGTNSVVCPNTVMRCGSKLGDLSMLANNTFIPNNEHWSGSPAAKDKNTDAVLDEMMSEPIVTSRLRLILLGSIQAFIIILLPLVVLIPYLPVGATLFFLYYQIGYWSLFATPLLAPLYILALSLEIILLKKIFLNKVAPGTYQLDSLFYIRKWIVDQLINISLVSMNTLYATLYTAPFLRLLGAKIGKRVEVSTVSSISPELLCIKDESFIADIASLGAPKIYMGKLNLAATVIGERTFIGNAALVSGGSTLGDNCLIGVLSTCPKDQACENGTSWLGLPPMFLPKRDINDSFSQEETYKPTRALYAKRYTIEFFRVTLPTAINMATSMMAIFAFAFFYGKISTFLMILLLPILILAQQLVGALIVVALKWIVVGKYVPRVKPLWSTFVWRSEFTTGLYEDVVVSSLLHNLMGTPFVCFILRAFGVKIGKRVYLDTTFVTEFDLVKVGSDSAINYNCSLQTHLFEDRVMKMSHVDVGDNCTMGNRAIFLYDAKMNIGANLRSLSLLMKGESLPENTLWEGSPAQNVE